MPKKASGDFDRSKYINDYIKEKYDRMKKHKRVYKRLDQRGPGKEKWNSITNKLGIGLVTWCLFLKKIKIMRIILLTLCA